MSCGAKAVIRLSSWLVSVYSLLETGLKLNASLFVQQLCQVPMSPYRRDQLAVPSQVNEKDYGRGDEKR